MTAPDAVRPHGMGTSPAPGTLPGAVGPPRHGLVTLRGLWEALRGWRHVYLASVAFNVVSLLAASGATVAGAWAVSQAVTGRPAGDLVVPAVLTGVLVVVRALCAWWETWLAHDLSFRMLARTRMWIYDAIARISPAGISRRRSGDLLTSSLSDAESLEIYYAHSSIYALSAWVTTPLIWSSLLLVSAPAALAVAPVLVLCVVVTLLARRWSVPQGREIRAALAELGGQVAEDIGAAREIVGYGLVEQRTRMAEAADRRLATAQFRNARRAGAETAALGVVALLAGVAAAVAASRQHDAGALDTALIPVVVILGGATTVALLQWGAMTRHYGGTREAAARITALLRATPPVRTHGDAAADLTAPASATAERVSFHWRSVDAHASPRLAVDAVSTTIAPGTSLAIAGRSGAGKSTFAHLLARFMDPIDGRITVLGHDLRDFSRADLSRVVSLLPQDVALFQESVRDNLLLAVESPVDDDELWRALRLAHADEIVRRLPDGLDTVLSENGASLSGGERQRLALARAVLHPAAILILDESVSQLDVLSENDVHDALVSVRAGRTTITIAHRLSTLLRAERILVLDDGALVGDGTHPELLRSCPAYARLVEPQLEAAVQPDH